MNVLRDSRPLASPRGTGELGPNSPPPSGPPGLDPEICANPMRSLNTYSVVLETHTVKIESLKLTYMAASWKSNYKSDDNMRNKRGNMHPRAWL